ncbi:fumarate hydratase [candidate division WOR-3 bacterium]|nr:fumarate hydratase [candidate division WOR-3 bacterium]
MAKISKKNIEEILIEAIEKAETELPKDVIKALKNAAYIEKGLAKIQMEAILENIKIASKEGIPMCQDTGIMTFYIQAGTEFKYLADLKKMLENAVKRATKETPLRPNTVNPFTGENSGDNLGRNIPYISWDMVKGSECIIHILPKGGGSENMSALWMLNSAEGFDKAKKLIVEHIINAGGQPCPPTIAGIGIGGGADICMQLAKKSLLRKIGEPHREKKVAKMEKELFELINKTGIGPMGMGGATTVLDVHIEYAHRHPASFPVGLVLQCWANRRKVIKFEKNGSIKVI